MRSGPSTRVANILEVIRGEERQSRGKCVPGGVGRGSKRSRKPPPLPNEHQFTTPPDGFVSLMGGCCCPVNMSV